MNLRITKVPSESQTIILGKEWIVPDFCINITETATAAVFKIKCWVKCSSCLTQKISYPNYRVSRKCVLGLGLYVYICIEKSTFFHFFFFFFLGNWVTGTFNVDNDFALINLSRNKSIKGVLHLLPQKVPKLACFVLYLKNINIFLKNNICILQ